MTDDPRQHLVFETSAGFAAIGWIGDCVVRFRLPAPTRAESEAACPSGWQSAAAEPPTAIGAVIERASAYFRGERVDFADIAVDLGRQDRFFADAYAFVRRLAWGETTTYGAVAAALRA